MRKTCVRWTKCVRTSLIVAIAIVSALALDTRAQSNDPSTLPILNAQSFEYIGAFRLPKQSINGDSFSYGGKLAAFSPSTHSLFVSSRANRLAEVTAPSPLLTADVAQMPMATFLQGFSDPTEGRLPEVASSGVSLAGLMVYGDRLIGTASIYYDATNTQKLSHFSHSMQLNQPSFSGWTRVWDDKKTGFVSGYMSLVPAEWRSRLGGPAVTGQCCIPIVTRTSWGPAALAFEPSQVGQPTAPAAPLLFYTGEHQTLGTFSGSNPVYGGTIQMGGMAIIGGTRTAVFVGRNGLGPYCYGNGTADQSLHGTPSPDGTHWCYDPTSNAKGQHAYPYRYQMWAYDLNDLAAVKAGQKQPWDVVPYGVWPFDLPTYEKSFTIGGVTYDSASQQLYVTQMAADKVGVASHPLVHVFKIDIPPAPVPVSQVTLTADRTAPQLAGAPVTFSAVTTDGDAPIQFKWAVSTDGTTWTPSTSWSTANTFAWTPASANANYRIGVWARSAWNSDDAGDASASMPFAIAVPPPPPPPPPPAPITTSKVTAVTISPDLAGPYVTGTAVTWTASPTGGGPALLYKWLVHNGANWIIYKHWSSDSSFTYVPGIAGGNKVSVWVKNASNLADQAEASIASPTFSVVGLTMVTMIPPPQTSPKMLAVFVSPDQAAPQEAGSTITWSATPVGGSVAPLYKWMLYNGAGWVAQTGWTSASTFQWTPATPNAKYKLSVWVKSSTNTADAAEASTNFEYVITGLTPQ